VILGEALVSVTERVAPPVEPASHCWTPLKYDAASTLAAGTGPGASGPRNEITTDTFARQSFVMMSMKLSPRSKADMPLALP
jgi:hypothetical protein